MENTIDVSELENIYSTNGFWIGRIGGVEFQAFFLIVQDQRAVSNSIAVEIEKQDVTRIIDSNGDLRIVEELAKDLKNGYLYVTNQKK